MSWSNYALGALGLVGAALAVLFKYQDRLLYLPQFPAGSPTPDTNPPKFRSPAEYEIEFDDLTLRAEDGTSLHAWFLKQPDVAQVPTIVFFHANAGNMGWRLPFAVGLFRRMRVNVFMLSYRGYGKSSGTPTEAGLQLDADATMRHLLHERTDIDKSKLIMFGRSLGGAVAIYVAHKFPEAVRALIIENTFTCIGEMVDVVMPLLARFKSLILRIDWNSLERIRSVTAPILFLSGLKDELVPPEHMQRLFDAATRSALPEMHTVPDGTHNDTYVRGGEAYWVAMVRFVDSVCSPQH